MSAQSNVGVGQDPVQVDANHYAVEFENEKVRVLRVRYGPHEKSAMHAHPGCVAVFLTAAAGRFTFPDGKVEDIDVPAGHAMHMDPTVHEPENRGAEPFEVVLVELKF
jgi:quercetin dioxygenase-like cupin family protein